MFNFVCLSSGHYIYVSKDMRIRGYLPQPERAAGKKKKCEGEPR